MDNQRFNSCIFLITYGVGLMFLAINFSLVMSIIGKCFIVLLPFIYGFIISYIVNYPYNFMYNNIKTFNNDKIRKCVCLVVSYIIVLGVFCFLITIILPQIISSVNQLVNNFSSYVESADSITNDIINFLHIGKIGSSYITDAINSMIKNMDKVFTVVFPSLYNITINFTTGIYNWIVGFVISIYFLSNKEILLSQIKKVMSAIFSPKLSDKIFRIIDLSHFTFGKFISGKILDSMIIGVLCFIGMKILNLPYSVLISVVVGVTNVIPFFGPFIGAIPSIFILLIIKPVYALWFSIFILILQQLDGNIIGPKILGNTIGISGMWVMFSVIIGGGLFGIPGMFIGVPVFAVIYEVFRGFINKRLEKNSCETQGM